MATTSTTTLAASNANVTNFRAWTQAITAALSLFGWTQTSDTGQANLTTATVPSSNYVYQIWKATDAAASTTPIYLRLDFGYNTSNPSCKFTIGSGSDGAGNITGGVVGPCSMTGGDTNLSNQSATTKYNCYFSGNAGEFRIMLWQNNSNACCVVGIERSKDTSGNVTTAYVTLLSLNANSNQWFQQTMVGSNVTPQEFAVVTFCSSSNPQTGSFGGSTLAAPVFPLIGQLGNPMLGFFCAASADASEGGTVTVNVYGAAHTCLATKQNNIGNSLGKLGNSGGALLMRYE